MRVNQVAKIFSITPETVRFYTRKGYLNPSINPENGYKEYSEKDCSRLRFILSARRLSFSVNDIGEILKVADKKRSACPLVRKLIEQRLAEVDQQFKETAKLRKKMMATVKEWQTKPDKAPSHQSICHLIEGVIM
jgi:DNA-binding transcriptional MerR regulator